VSVARALDLEVEAGCVQWSAHVVHLEGDVPGGEEVPVRTAAAAAVSGETAAAAGRRGST